MFVVFTAPESDPIKIRAHIHLWQGSRVTHETFVSYPIVEMIVRSIGLLDYDKNHNHDYFGQYCNL